ncbi:MAG: hypothetical protein P8Y67_11730 [Alphaproteobacteria bacterium]
MRSLKPGIGCEPETFATGTHDVADFIKHGLLASPCIGIKRLKVGRAVISLAKPLEALFRLGFGRVIT